MDSNLIKQEKDDYSNINVYEYQVSTKLEDLVVKKGTPTRCQIIFQLLTQTLYMEI